MAIQNFDFPGVELTQVFEEATYGVDSTLGVACVGPQYKTHNADSADAALIPQSGANVYKPATGIAAQTLPGWTSGAVVDTDVNTQRLVISNGQFAYKTLTGTTLSGSAVDCKKVVKTGLGYFAEDGFVTGGAKVGDTVVLTGTSGGSAASATTRIADFKFVTGSGYTQIIPESLGALTAVASASFCLGVDRTVISSGGVTITSTGAGQTPKVAVSGGISTTLADVSGATGALQSGELYVEYRAKADDFVGVLGSVASPADVQDVLGTPCVDNPLALAVYFAASAAKGMTVYFTAVGSDTAQAYTSALDFLDKYSNIYSIVPVSEDESVVRACATAVVGSSEDAESKIKRTLWYGVTDDISAAGATNEAKVANIISKRWTNSYRAQAVWGDGALFNGESIKNFALAAAAAGMRSYEPCHRPLSNLGYTHFSLVEPNGFTRSQLKTLGANGIWIVANNMDGAPVNMRQITTAMKNNLNVDEESIVSNADEIALALCHVGENWVGNSNISQDLLYSLTDTINRIMDARTVNTSGSSYVGPQLLDWSLDSLYQDTTNLDWVYATISCTPPKPFNKFKMTLRVI